MNSPDIIWLVLMAQIVSSLSFCLVSGEAEVTKITAQQQVRTSIGDMSRADVTGARREDDVTGHGPTLLRKASHIQYRTAHPGDVGAPSREWHQW